MFHKFPYTDFHELNLDYIMYLCKETMGLYLVVEGNNLKLKNANHDTISNVTISYAEKAAKDVNGNDIDAYLLNAGTEGTHVVFTHGDGTITTLTIPYAEKANKDVDGKEIEDYVYNMSIAGDKVRITKGDSTVVELTIPYAVKASTDAEGKDLTTYAASLEVDGTEIVLRDSKGRQLSRLTVPYSLEANHADEADTALEADHADEADVAEHATDAVETITISGNDMIFTTYGGDNFSITCPYAIKAQKDDLGNTIKATYVANVVNDSQTGELTFLDATGNEIVSLTPAVTTATNDSYGNRIADYIKTILVDSNSNYVTVTHGTGNTDSLIINYAAHAWKDTNENVIKNTYIKYMECVEDVQDGKYKLVCYDGDNPMAELFRLPLICDMAAHDVNGRDLTSYVGAVEVDSSDDTIINILDGEDTTINSISGTVTVTPSGSVSGTAVAFNTGTLPSISYDSATETLTFSAGTLPSIGTITDPSFTGNAATVNVDFSDTNI